MTDDATMTTVAWAACTYIAGLATAFFALQSYARMFAKSPTSRTWLSDRLPTSMAQSKDVDMMVATEAQRTPDPQLAIRLDAPKHDVIDPDDLIMFTVFNALDLPERISVARVYLRRFICMDRPARANWSGDKHVYTDLLRAGVGYGLVSRRNAKDYEWGRGLKFAGQRVQWLAARNVRV